MVATTLAMRSRSYWYMRGVGGCVLLGGGVRWWGCCWAWLQRCCDGFGVGDNSGGGGITYCVSSTAGEWECGRIGVFGSLGCGGGGGGVVAMVFV